MRDQRIVFSQKVTFEPLSVAIHPGQTEVAVGGEAVRPAFTQTYCNPKDISEPHMIEFALTHKRNMDLFLLC